MDFVTELLNQYGYPILCLLGLVEFLGVPVATSPVLLLDAIAVILWSSLYVLAGGVFENEVHAAHAGEWRIPGPLVGTIAAMPKDKSPGARA